MPSRIDAPTRIQQDRDRQPGRTSIDEPRNFGQPSPAIHTQHDAPHPGFDDDLNPVDDEFINTHGSER